MKIRNLLYGKLNFTEKKVVREHRESQLKDEKSGCKKGVCNNSVEEFWELHKELVTKKGTYNGWIEPDNLQTLVEEKLEKIKNEQNRNT